MEVAKEESGATEAERGTARSIAMRIMDDHGLKESQIPQRNVESNLQVPLPAAACAYLFEWEVDGLRTTITSGNSF